MAIQMLPLCLVHFPTARCSKLLEEEDSVADVLLPCLFDGPIHVSAIFNQEPS